MKAAHMSELTPAESWVIWKGQDGDAQHAIKVTLIALIARGYVRLHEIETRGVFRPRRKQVVSTTAKSLGGAPPDIAAVYGAVATAQSQGQPDMAALVKTFVERFGQGFKRFVHEMVAPRLEARGLIRRVPRRVLIFALWPRIELTPAGEIERTRIASSIANAGDIARLLRTDPTRAAAMAIGLGSLIYLASELWPFYGSLGEAMRRHGDWADGGSGSGGGGGGGDSAPQEPALPSLEGFDMTAFDGLDAAMASFDSGFDSAADAGGGGDSGGGGDGGGGGGGD